MYGILAFHYRYITQQKHQIQIIISTHTHTHKRSQIHAHIFHKIIRLVATTDFSLDKISSENMVNKRQCRLQRRQRWRWRWRWQYSNCWCGWLAMMEWEKMNAKKEKREFKDITTQTTQTTQLMKFDDMVMRATTIACGSLHIYYTLFMRLFCTLNGIIYFWKAISSQLVNAFNASLANKYEENMKIL